MYHVNEYDVYTSLEGHGNIVKFEEALRLDAGEAHGDVVAAMVLEYAAGSDLEDYARSLGRPSHASSRSARAFGPAECSALTGP